MKPTLPVRLANAFLAAYALDAGLSLLVLAVLPESAPPALVALQRLVASVVFAMVFVVLWIVAFSPRVPLPLFLGLCSSVAWLATGAAPLPLSIPPDAGLPVALAGIQAGIAVAAFVRVRALRRGGGWFLRDDTLGEVRAGAGRPLRFAAVFVLLMVPLLAAYAVVSLDTWIEVGTERFVSLDLSGIQLADRRYARAGREIRLVGMMHLGEGDNYRDVTHSFVSEDTIVLEEGVSDEHEVLTESLSYERLAHSLGLTTQHSMSHYLRSDDPGDTGGPVWPVIRNADVDASTFGPATLEVLAYAARIWSAEEPLPAFIELYHYLLEHPDDADQFVSDVISRRNHHLLGEIADALDHYPRVIVPWGALHLPEIERHVLDEGFVLEGETRHRAVAWSTLFEALF